ncbi:MerR family transcriptional regulator [Pseudochryseolinea flava]|uniref:Heavy metal-responsive transcriptional regulator n=1 Tax=Pseudochryseolinea flava TaxID=2059302 RepID=A0A364Y7D8_9BACT|nr:MerR family transcriptional regulator [Pseudochryseolinea flava]RAW01744.1 heavy metal-responsive transcriptional regulator [Pseudochryseolinea flava]
MLIGELSEKTKLSRHTIRFYEKLGLIEVPEDSRRGNNYKEYPDDILRKIAAIQEIKSRGFTLKEAKRILELITSGTLDPSRSKKYIEHKVSLIDKQIRELEQTKANLIELAEICGSTYCPVNEILNGPRPTIKD